MKNIDQLPVELSTGRDDIEGLAPHWYRCVSIEEFVYLEERNLMITYPHN